MNHDFGDFELYGLRIRSEVPLPARPARPGAPVDMEITLGPVGGVGDELPPGTVIAHFELSRERWYAFCRQEGGGYVLRFAQICDFLVSEDLHHVEVRPAAEAANELLPIFASGGLPAFVLVMKGEPVLHASAVDLGGRAVAFVGRSGMGKSTMAALCCLAGGKLITDDVLRLTHGPEPRCHWGPDELRLRSAASELADDFAEPPPVRATADGRAAVHLTAGAGELVPLAAIVIPMPDRGASAPVVERLDAVRALMALVAFPRLLGWQDRTTMGRQFELMTELNQSVPVYTARVPWGPPFPPNVAAEVLGAAGLGVGGP